MRAPPPIPSPHTLTALVGVALTVISWCTVTVEAAPPQAVPGIMIESNQPLPGELAPTAELPSPRTLAEFVQLA